MFTKKIRNHYPLAMIPYYNTKTKLDLTKLFLPEVSQLLIANV